MSNYKGDVNGLSIVLKQKYKVMESLIQCHNLVQAYRSVHHMVLYDVKCLFEITYLLAQPESMET